MHKNYDMLSDLERELELDMTDSAEFEVDANEETDEPGEFESADDEFEDLDEAEFETDGYETDESEADDSETGEFGGDLADRLYQISQREFENPEEAGEAIDGVLNEMYENFLGLGSVKKFLKNKGLKLLKQGIKIASNHPLLKSIFAGKSLKDILSTVAQAAASSTPLGAAVMPLVKSIGFTGDEPAEQKEAWANFVDVAREAYNDLASNLNEAANHPLRGQRLAAQAFARGMRRVIQRRRQGFRRSGGGPGRRRRVIRIHVKPGQRKHIRLDIVGH